MFPARSPLPPFAALRAFHAAAGHERFRDAAEALGVTESAISHQIRRLEEFLHVALFERAGGRTRLTAAGRRYFEAIEPAMRQIRAATEAAMGQSGRKVVRLTLSASLAVSWLIPKLKAFEQAHSDIELQLITTTRVLNLKRDQIDLAIRHGKGNWADVTAAFLFDESAFPVCAPGYLPDSAMQDPAAALKSARFIVNTNTPDEWDEWCRARALPPPSPAAIMEIEGQEEALKVAEQGMGIAIGRLLMVDDRMAGGGLVAPFGIAGPSAAAYYLCRPDNVTPNAATRRVERWLRDLAAAT